MESAIGSGGAFAVGVFTRTDRVLELHVRHALGIVAYRAAGVVITHQDLMWAVALGQAPAYPGFSADSLDGVRHLAADLAAFGGVFLRGSDEEFLAAVTRGEELAAARRGLGAVR